MKAYPATIILKAKEIGGENEETTSKAGG